MEDPEQAESQVSEGYGTLKNKSQVKILIWLLLLVIVTNLMTLVYVIHRNNSDDSSGEIPFSEVARFFPRKDNVPVEVGKSTYSSSPFKEEKSDKSDWDIERTRAPLMCRTGNYVTFARWMQEAVLVEANMEIFNRTLNGCLLAICKLNREEYARSKQDYTKIIRLVLASPHFKETTKDLCDGLGRCKLRSLVGEALLQDNDELLDELVMYGDKIDLTRCFHPDIKEDPIITYLYRPQLDPYFRDDSLLLSAFKYSSTDFTPDPVMLVYADKRTPAEVYTRYGKAKFLLDMTEVKDGTLTYETFLKEEGSITFIKYVVNFMYKDVAERVGAFAARFHEEEPKDCPYYAAIIENLIRRANKMPVEEIREGRLATAWAFLCGYRPNTFGKDGKRDFGPLNRLTTSRESE